MKLSMQKYNFSFKIDNFSRKKIRILLKMLSKYYILPLRFPEPKLETIASAYYPEFFSRLPLPLHQKVVPLQSNFSENQA